MWLTEPWWLLALIPIIPVFFGESIRRRRMKSEGIPGEQIGGPDQRKKLRPLMMLRLSAIVVVVLALAGFSILLPSRHRSVAVLLDVSGSIDRRETEREREKALHWIGRLKSQDRVAVICFAGRARTFVPLTNPAEAIALLESADLKAVQPERTDLQAAFRAAYAQLQTTYGNRGIILFSDGRPNAGGLDSSTVSGHGDIPIYTVPIGIPEQDLITTNLIIPEHLRQEETGGLLWQVNNNKRRIVEVTLKVDGRSVSRQQLRIEAGKQRIRLELPSQNTGLHRVELMASGEGGKRYSLADGGGIINVSGPAQVLVIHGDALPSPISRTLTIQGCQVRDMGLAGIREESDGLNGYSAVVLDNVTATDMDPTQHHMLANYVSSGGGLLVVGGDHSLGLGEYYDTSLEELLPVRTDTRQRLRFSRANILFIIDHSGSMSDLLGKTSKQLAAMKGIVAAAEGMNPLDEVGIITFSSRTSWVLPFTKASRKDRIKQALDRLDAGGGTEMADALDEAARGLAGRGPVGKHVILLSDGITGQERMRDICDKLRAIGATITTIGVGDDVNETLLRSVARWGQGNYYRAKGDQIPKVIIKETVRVTRDLINEGEFRPKIQNDSEIIQGLNGPLPEIKGYLLTKAKGMADIVLSVGPKGDPLLAVWRYGSGRVAVFTGDSGRGWLAGWSGGSFYNLFWAQLVRSLEKRSPDGGLHLSARPEAGRIRIVVEAIDNERHLRSGLQLVGRSGDGPDAYFRLTERAPGYYEAVVPANTSGLQEFEVRDAQSGTWSSGGIWNPPGKELRALGPDHALLGYFSAASGGEILSMTDSDLPRVGWSWEPLSLRFILILLALLIFLVEMGLRSTSLGQFGMFRAAVEVWRQAQTRLIALARGSFGPRREGTAVQNAREIVETNRFLAERRRKHRE